MIAFVHFLLCTYRQLDIYVRLDHQAKKLYTLLKERDDLIDDDLWNSDRAHRVQFKTNAWKINAYLKQLETNAELFLQRLYNEGILTSEDIDSLGPFTNLTILDTLSDQVAEDEINDESD